MLDGVIEPSSDGVIELSSDGVIESSSDQYSSYVVPLTYILHFSSSYVVPWWLTRTLLLPQ